MTADMTNIKERADAAAAAAAGVSVSVTTPNEAVLDVEHLSITEKYPIGTTRNIHLMNDDDLSVKLARGDEKFGMMHAEGGLVLVALDIDEDHDDISVTATRGTGMEECLREAIEALQLAVDALKRVRKA